MKGQEVVAGLPRSRPRKGDIEFKERTLLGGGHRIARSPSAGWRSQARTSAHKFLVPGPRAGALKEGAFYDPHQLPFSGRPPHLRIEIDPDTGVTRIERFTAVDDFGVVINPMIVEGQVHGGIAQGVGQALMEAAIYDESGQLVTASYQDYQMPRAGDLPSFHVGMTSTPCPSNPLGIKGCGEAGAIAAPPAVMNAVTDAIGHEDIAMPATPQAVWRAIQRARPAIAAE